MTNETPHPSPSNDDDASMLGDSDLTSNELDDDVTDADADAVTGAGTDAEADVDADAAQEPGEPHVDEAPQPPPPPPNGLPNIGYQPPVRRLVRDPYTRLGGVASGLSHYSGIDTSIIRILFIITTFTGGFGLLVYLLAWLVIPRADHWPPATSLVSYRNMSGRDLGIGLAVVGLMVAVGFGASGTTGAVLVPLALVAGGVWLLIQPPSAPVPAGANGSAPPPAAAPVFVAASGPVGAPVPPPKRRRWRWLIVLGALASVFLLLMIPVLIVLALAFGSFGDTTRFTPATVEEIPTFFSDDVDRLVIDLSRLDATDFDAETEPIEIDAELDLGSITVIVPDDISVSVDSNVDLGAVTVFGESTDGFDSTIFLNRSNDDDTTVDLDLKLDIDIGEISVERP
ncbi:MAG: PspC domain-containing protein [Ilumatobacter sp.]